MIYSESIHIEKEIEPQWLIWAKGTYITTLQNTNLFSNIVFTKVISHEDPTGFTYSIQCYLEKEVDIDDFYTTHKESLHRLIASEFGSKALTFSTELKIITSI